jgi:YggT family protein
MAGFVFRIASVLIYLFAALCTVRIVSTWFAALRGSGQGRAERALAAMTDWYFRLFSRMRVLKRGRFDFTPTFALVVLVLPAAAFSMLGQTGRADAGVLLGIGLTAIWSAFAFLLAVLILLIVIRLAAFALRMNTFTPFMAAVEALTDPLLYRIGRILFGKRIVKFRTSLAAAALVLAALWAAGEVLVRLAAGALGRLPF